MRSTRLAVTCPLILAFHATLVASSFLTVTSRYQYKETTAQQQIISSRQTIKVRRVPEQNISSSTASPTSTGPPNATSWYQPIIWTAPTKCSTPFTVSTRAQITVPQAHLSSPDVLRPLLGDGHRTSNHPPHRFRPRLLRIVLLVPPHGAGPERPADRDRLLDPHHGVDIGLHSDIGFEIAGQSAGAEAAVGADAVRKEVEAVAEVGVSTHLSGPVVGPGAGARERGGKRSGSCRAWKRGRKVDGKTGVLDAENSQGGELSSIPPPPYTGPRGIRLLNCYEQGDILVALNIVVSSLAFPIVPQPINVTGYWLLCPTHCSSQPSLKS
ncbi:hypothetical protein P152DRAFT_452519 [Eremomyces bilateralis CBS 781.70]|uniref:Uncharacterized protein n=1 Tax=Eremomyces bilateralis CBS 781.70 TaxID=1392243 RepID=A0A6G1FT10_9PEZI|nr:uncharacterized protein P152DRAFT_452519 [Eremomyces bilateralis CBS 781.70]KAF1808866.1 hypothetical protein P152DRAFT_452519 [Eremomyces bilateralis CBS 781.70]